MSGYRHIIYVIVSILLLNASNLFAKVYWLPDYLGDNTNRSNGLEDNPQNGVVDKERGCPNGWLDAAQKGDMICDLMGNYPWVGYCYSNCKCNPDKYLYTEENCSGTKAPTGSSCDDGSGTIYYNQCIDACDTVEGVTNCPYGCKTTFEAEGCPTECKECYTDNCHNRTSVEPCDYGCESYFSDCSSKCQKCYADNCRNRTDNATDLGCDSYWQDCPSKCEVGKTCVPTDCSAYTLTSCPANATCESCDIGCNQGTKHKISTCASGYEQSGNSCIVCDYGDFTLSKCPSNGNCTSITCGGITRYKLNSCKTGYEMSGNTCIELCDPIDCSGRGYKLTSCPSGELCAICQKGCGDTTNYYKIAEGAIVVDVKGQVGINIFADKMVGEFFTIDFGDGNGPKFRLASGDGFNSGTSWLVDESNAQDVWTITITGDPQSFNMRNVLKIHRLDLASLKSINFSCNEANPDLTGSIPELPPNLEDGYDMFWGCSKLTGNIPQLPSLLTRGEYMFCKCKELSGSIPELPPNLTKGNGMFMDCSNLTGNIPELPSSLEHGRQMFSQCSGLSGNIPTLPSSLRDAHSMFSNCSGLSGNIPSLPRSIQFCGYMFHGCSGLSGNIPSLPRSIYEGDGMFDGCTGLTGNIPSLPSSLKKGKYMFYHCSSLTGNIPELPSGLTEGNSMFNGCSGLIGIVPAKPSNLTSYSGIFYQTSTTNDGTWPDSAWSW